jgi:hypothetical protein
MRAARLRGACMIEIPFERREATLRHWRGGRAQPIPPAGGSGVGPARTSLGPLPPPRRTAS